MMEDLQEAVANAETALADLRLALHRHRTDADPAHYNAIRITVQEAYDLVTDIQNNIEEGRDPFDKV